jgi:hypothetical protein
MTMIPHTTILSRFFKSTALTAACCASLLAAGQPAHAGRGGPTITQKGGTLSVVGNRGDDRLVIHRSGDTTVPGEIEVWDVGVSPGVIGVYSGVQNIHVDLLGGNNFLGLYRFEVAGDVTVLCGDGDNQVYVGGVGETGDARIAIDGNLSVTTGAGLDLVRIESCAIGGALIDTGDSDDWVLFGHHLDTGIFHPGTIIGPLAVSTGEGNDLVAMLGAELSDTGIDTAGGDDWVLVGIGIEDGAWTIRGNEFSSAFFTDTGMGNDFVVLLGTWAFSDVTILTGQQSDEVWLGGLGAPNDFQGDVLADGGGGNDTLLNDATNSYAFPLQFLSFETVGP